MTPRCSHLRAPAEERSAKAAIGAALRELERARDRLRRARRRLHRLHAYRAPAEIFRRTGNVTATSMAFELDSGMACAVEDLSNGIRTLRQTARLTPRSVASLERRVSQAL